jgi:hypothetical protein
VSGPPHWSTQVDGDNIVGKEHSAKLLRLAAHLIHKIRAEYALWEAREILYLGSVHEGSAVLKAFEN